MENFSLIKTLKSFVLPLDWWKAIMIGLKILGIGLICLTVYRAWFMATQSQDQITKIDVRNGGTVNLQQEQKQGDDKNWLIGPYAEADFSKDNGYEGWSAGLMLLRRF